MVLSAAVSAGITSPLKAWPEFFDGPDEGDSGAFPSTDADMEDFELEQATPSSFTRDMELLEQVAASQHVSLREEAPPPFPRLSLPDTEWTLSNRDHVFRGVTGPAAPISGHADSSIRDTTMRARRVRTI